MLKDKRGTIFTDSKYAFGVVQTFRKIWEERGLMNSQGKGLIHETLIKQTLEALRGPKQIAVVYVKGHRKGTSTQIRGNNLADEEAKKAALLVIKAVEQDSVQTRYAMRFTNQEKEKLGQMGVVEQEGKWWLPDEREMLPKGVAW